MSSSPCGGDPIAAEGLVWTPKSMVGSSGSCWQPPALSLNLVKKGIRHNMRWQVWHPIFFLGGGMWWLRNHERLFWFCEVSPDCTSHPGRHHHLWSLWWVLAHFQNRPCCSPPSSPHLSHHQDLPSFPSCLIQRSNPLPKIVKLASIS